MSESTFRVGFVCTGNLCRSPYGEYALRQRLENAGVADRVEVCSSGTMGLEGLPMPASGLEAAAARGVDVTAHLATPLGLSGVARCDVLFGMAAEHVETLRAYYAERAEQIFLLSAYPKLALDGADMPDPMGHGVEVFSAAFDEIDAQLDRVTPQLLRGWGLTD